jgi:hypothetical protein
MSSVFLSSYVLAALAWVVLDLAIFIPGDTYILDPHMWLWVFTALPVNSAALMIFREALPRFWAVCAAWGCACLATDALWGTIPWSDPAQAALEIGSDLTGGMLVGWLFWKPLSKVAIMESDLARHRRARILR